MTLPRHVSREPRPGDRGRGFGAACADEVARTVAVYRRMLGVDLLEAGAAIGSRLAVEWPELVEELDGIAAGAGVDARELLAINARTELLAGSASSECSLLGRRSREGAWLAQTWDWHPEVRPVVWTVHGAGGRWFTTVTEAGVLAKLGHNGDGVACGLNFLTCSADGGLDGVPIHVVLRLVLERCASGREARALLGAVRTAASSCVSVAGADGSLFAAELAPGGARFVEPDEDGWLVHTNHFLLAPVAGVDTLPGPGTLDRFARVARGARSGWSPPRVLAQHGGEPEPVCRHDDPPGTPWAERRATLLAIWAEPARRSLRVAPGPPCVTPFEAV